LSYAVGYYVTELDEDEIVSVFGIYANEEIYITPTQIPHFKFIPNSHRLNN
jgi:hypothetical protein